MTCSFAFSFALKLPLLALLTSEATIVMNFIVIVETVFVFFNIESLALLILFAYTVLLSNLYYIRAALSQFWV